MRYEGRRCLLAPEGFEMSPPRDPQPTPSGVDEDSSGSAPKKTIWTMFPPQQCALGTLQHTALVSAPFCSSAKQVYSTIHYIVPA